MKILRKESWRQRKTIRNKFENANQHAKFRMQLKLQCNNEDDFLNCECCGFDCGWKIEGEAHTK